MIISIQWRRFFQKFFIKKLFSNFKFTSHYREPFLIDNFSLFLWLCLSNIHAFKKLDINQNWNRNSSSLYCYNLLPLYLFSSKTSKIFLALAPVPAVRESPSAPIIPMSWGLKMRTCQKLEHYNLFSLVTWWCKHLI